MTYNRIRHEYVFEPPATVHVKGKGEMVMYRLTSRLGDEKRQSSFARSSSADPYQGVSGQLSA
jgi:hypothetical protein